MDNCIPYMFTVYIPTSIVLNICYLFTELGPMAPDFTVTLGTMMCNWSLERKSSSPSYKVQHGNVATVLFSLSLSIMMHYPSHACANRGNGIGDMIKKISLN